VVIEGSFVYGRGDSIVAPLTDTCRTLDRLDAPCHAGFMATSTDLGDHDEYMQWTSYGRGLCSAEAPDGDLYVLTEHPQVPGKYWVTKGFDLNHSERRPHTHIDVVTGLIAAQRAAEDHAHATFPNWKPSANHPAAQRLGVRS
jgi:hypothetical protein